MILGTEERDRCQKGLVSCSSDWEHTVVSAEEARALSMYTAPVLLSWGVCRWIPPRTSLSPELPVTLGSPLRYTAPSGALSHPPCRPPADLRISFSIRLFLELLPYTPGVWHTARSDLSLSSPTSQSSPTSGFLFRSPSLSMEEEQLLESRPNVTGLAHHVVFLLR